MTYMGKEGTLEGGIMDKLDDIYGTMAPSGEREDRACMSKLQYEKKGLNNYLF